MIGIDTNVLVRYLTHDDAQQYQQAKAFLETRCTGDTPGYVNAVVLCEVIWVLERAYDATKAEIIRVVTLLLQTKQLRLAHPESVRSALKAYEQSNADFADTLIAHLNQDAGCEQTVTFDQRAGRLTLFETL